MANALPDARRRAAYRAALTAGSIVLVGMVVLAFRTLDALGVFTQVVPGFAGSCSAISGVQGAEDIVIDEQLGVAIVSAADRRAKLAGKPSKQDGLYALGLTGTPHLTKLAGTPSDFHPHGISLIGAPDGEATLMAINHRGDGSSSIEIFALAKANASVTLRETGSIEGGELVSPNAIAALDQNRFYVTNDHTSKTAMGRALDDFLVLPRANVLYFDGSIFRIVAKDLNFPSGAVLSTDRKYLYVSEALNRRLTTYARDEFSGSLTLVNQLEIPSNLDNLRFDPAGRLWLGSHPKMLAFAAFRADPSKPSPSEIFEVTLAGGIPQSAAPVFSDLGSEIGGSSVAAVSGRRMLIGSPLDGKILDCTMAR